MPAATAGPHYLLADGLGSVRLRTDGAGLVDKCYDYLPFGEAVGVGVNGRPECYRQETTPAATAVGDWQRWQFTGQGRDWETGLDYFGARYYAGAMGRFVSADWSDKPEAVPYADFGDPQTLNLYAYGRNNPLRNRDLDGHCTVDGEEHNWLWCAGHSIGLTQTSKEAADAARAALSQMHGFTIDGQSPADFAKAASGAQLIQAQRAANEFMAAEGLDAPLSGCSPGVLCGVVPILPGAGAARWVRVGRWMSKAELAGMEFGGLQIRRSRRGLCGVRYSRGCRATSRLRLGENPRT